MEQNWLMALLGGALIGAAVSLMLLWNGRVTGISGILNGALARRNADSGWRWSFLGGLLAGGGLLHLASPNAFTNTVQSSEWSVAVAGLLVGFGTVMGSGCTSGHGICGISRLSPRSIAATLVFMASGILAVAFFKRMGVLP